MELCQHNIWIKKISNFKTCGKRVKFHVKNIGYCNSCFEKFMKLEAARAKHAAKLQPR